MPKIVHFLFNSPSSCFILISYIVLKHNRLFFQILELIFKKLLLAVVLEPKDTNQNKVNVTLSDLTSRLSEPHPTYGTITYFKYLQQKRILTNAMVAFCYELWLVCLYSLNN